MKKKLLITMLALLGMSQAVAQEQVFLPLVREGVKWVNEKVIIDHGDTTRYYYTYEFSGYDLEETNIPNFFYNACYYSTGESLGIERDSLIAGLYDIKYDNFNGYDVFCYRNYAYEKVHNEQREMLPSYMYTDGGRIKLYQFGVLEDGHDRTIDFYMLLESWAEEVQQPFLSRDNFIRTDPVAIDGVVCQRYAYIDERGDTAAYIVEGIGFDSRDMGDLLTPFMRQPDPDADYQEYCGLSHVIKDGKIIYKGLRYNPDAVTILPGDVNGDGEITIADANGVIDIVVMGDNPSHPRVPSGSGKDPADLNGDGEVNIADVNAIIDLIVNDK